MPSTGDALSIRIRGSQPCGATMRGARSGQAAGAALRKYSTPLRQTSWILGRPARSLGMHRPVSARRFPLWTTPIAARALSGAGQSAPPLLFGRNRGEKPERSPPRSVRRIPRSPGSAPDQVGQVIASPCRKGFFATFALPAADLGPVLRRAFRRLESARAVRINLRPARKLR